MKTTAALALGLAGTAQLCWAASATSASLTTFTVPVPSLGIGFTTTVSACDTVPAFAVVGVPNGTFFPGSATIYLPPQASPQTTTIIDSESNVTQVFVATPLPGTCADFALPSDATATVEPSATSSASVCPLEGCSAGVDQAAQSIISLINGVAIASQKLQNAVRQIGTKKTRGLEPRVSIYADIITPLRDIASTLSFGLPAIQVLAPFPPGCNSDTIVVALIDFVRIHQALLEILIGRAGLFSFSPFHMVEPEDTPDLDGEEFFNPLGTVIAGVLRVIETGVDAIAFSLINLIPTRQACIQQQKVTIDGTLKDAIAAYQS
ncbi:hypothetical protein GGR54DRAFT_64564 [Hypoxylon sp. NC1633]|nr:hypothetical protein GGR54DRAFT_64564 [Hypoxylon sp. NC1633]